MTALRRQPGADAQQLARHVWDLFRSASSRRWRDIARSERAAEDAVPPMPRDRQPGRFRRAPRPRCGRAQPEDPRLRRLETQIEALRQHSKRSAATARKHDGVSRRWPPASPRRRDAVVASTGPTAPPTARAFQRRPPEMVALQKTDAFVLRIAASSACNAFGHGGEPEPLGQAEQVAQKTWFSGWSQIADDEPSILTVSTARLCRWRSEVWPRRNRRARTLQPAWRSA